MAEYTHSDDERAFWARLSDEHIRDGYATIENQGGEYVSPIRRAAFESWLAAHDARVRRAAEREALKQFRKTELALIPPDADEDDPIRVRQQALAWRIEMHLLANYPEETP